MDHYDTCPTCKGTGQIRVKWQRAVANDLEPKLLDAPTLGKKITAICIHGQYSLLGIVGILQDHDATIEHDRVEYTVLNLEEEGIIVYNSTLMRYAINYERYTEDD